MMVSTCARSPITACARLARSLVVATTRRDPAAAAWATTDKPRVHRRRSATRGRHRPRALRLRSVTPRRSPFCNEDALREQAMHVLLGIGDRADAAIHRDAGEPISILPVCRLGSGGPICGTPWVDGAPGAAGAAGCCARMAVAVTSHAPAMITPTPANAMNPRRFMVVPCRNVRATQQMACHSDWRVGFMGAPVQNYQTVAPDSNPRGEFAGETAGPAGG